MTKGKFNGGPAYPHRENIDPAKFGEVHDYLGMSKLEVYAMSALQGLLASPSSTYIQDMAVTSAEGYAKAAFAVARAMVAEGEKQ